MPGVDPNLVPEGWVRNHYKWIVWNLNSLGIRLERQALTPSAVMDRLKYRYDREVDRAERSIIRRILEKDESAAVPMILFNSATSSNMLEVSDGWYSLPCCLEVGSPLYRVVSKGLLSLGTKIINRFLIK